MPTVLLIRHGRSTANADGILAGRLPEIALDDAGVDQARATAARLGDVSLAAVVTSPMLRCRQTAALLRPATEAVVEERLTECDYGDWSGRKLTDLADEQLWKVVQNQPAAAAFPGGESLRDMSARAVAAIRDHDARIAADHGPDAVWLAVSHGDIIKAIIADALGMHLDLFQRINVDPASLSIVRHAEARPMVLGMNLTGREIAALSKTGGDGDATVGGRDA